MEPTIPQKRPVWKEIMRRRLAQAEPKIREFAALGYGAEDIGPKVGRTPTTVRRYAAIMGLTLPNNGRKVFRLNKSNWGKKVPPLVKKGVKHRDIAQVLGCSASAVSKWLLNAGITVDRSCR